MDLRHTDIKEILYQTFSQSTLLTDLLLSDSLENIEAESFSYSGLNYLKVPSNVRYIDDAAFSYCSNLLSVNIGNAEKGSNILLLGTAPFQGCLNLKSIYIFSVQPPSLKKPLCGIANTGVANGYKLITNLQIFVPFSALLAYKNAVNNSLFDPLMQQSWVFHLDQLFGF